MQKQAPTPGKIFAMVGFALGCFAIFLFLWLAFGGPIPFQPQGYRVNVQFGEGPQIAQEADVRISGVTVGKVKAIQPNKSGYSKVTLQLDAKYAPIPKDTRATVRQKTLLGETYIELTPGSPNTPKLNEGGTIPASQVRPPTGIDEIFRSFDERTRAALQVWLQNQAQATAGRGIDLNAALGNLAPTLEDSDKLLEILNTQSSAVSQLVGDTGQLLQTVNDRGDQVQGLISSADTVFKTTADRDQKLIELFQALPTFQKELRQTLVELDEFAHTNDATVNSLVPAARELAPTARALQRLAPDLRTTLVGLGYLITASKDGLPALNAILTSLRPVLGQLDPFLRNLNPILNYVQLQKSEINSFFANFTAATQATESSGNRQVHYLRAATPVGLESLAAPPELYGTSRSNVYSLPREYANIAQGLSQFITANCGRPTPTLNPAPSPYLSDDLRNLINKFVIAPAPFGKTVAPPCKQQGKFNIAGTVTQYPQVKAQP